MGIGFPLPCYRIPLKLLIILYIFLNCCRHSSGETCPESMFSCTSGGCVNNSMVCDEIEDCKDASDEEDCVIECPEGWFHCTNGNCILMRWRCDGANDCGDQSDELNCGEISGQCSHEEFRCHDNSKCINMEWVCDGNQDCKDNSDETPGCVRQVPCNGFTCKGDHAECLPSRWHCDGSVDCSDGSDELDCAGPKNVSCLETDLQYWCKDKSLCIDKELVCNGIKNCDDGSDEGGQCDTHTCATAGCSHTCFQTPTSAVCYCPTGYTLAKKTCLDINECEILGSCSQTCENTPGSFSCSCHPGYQLEDKHSCRAEGPEPILIYSATQELHVIKLHSGLAYSLHHQLNHAVGVDYDSQDDRIYWTEIAKGVEAIKSSKLDGSDIQSLIDTGINVVEDVAVDWIGRNLYFTDSGFLRICVCKLDGRFCHILMENVKQPRALILEPSKGIMFWTDWSHTAAIERSGMDGSERVPILTSELGWPNGLAIDHVSDRLYWIDGKLRQIESALFDGSDRKVVFSDVMLHPFSLALFEDTFYWTDWVRHTLESCNKFTAGDHKVLIKEGSDNTPMGVHLYHPILQSKANNPCWGRDCSQLCLLAPAGRYSCACQLGDTLAPNGKSCLDNKVARLFVSIEDTIYEFLESNLGRNSLQPLESRAKMMVGAMTYNPTNHTIIYSDIGSDEILALNIDTEVQRTIISSHLDSVEGIAVDWISGNIYWIDVNRGTLEVCTSDGSHRMVIIDHRLDSPSALALEPTKGIMFVASKGNRPRIEQMDMDGSSRHIFIDYDVMAPVSLSVDHSRERLYWADDSTGKIEWVTLDGKERHVLKDYKGLPKSVAVTFRNIHWIDVAGNILLYKYNESNLPITSVGLHPHLDDKMADTIKLLAIHQSYPKGDNGCGLNNGKCSHFCLPNQIGHICACPSGTALMKDKLTCQVEANCNSHEFTCGDQTCIPLAFTCDNTKDCNDGSDEQNCRPTCTAKQFQCEDGTCIPASWKCDHKPQCVDASDEIGCKNKSCPGNYFTCDNGECIYENWKCDGQTDCHDKSDELHCPLATCPPKYFQCQSGPCVPDSWVCDGELDCRDGSDEFASCLVEVKKCDSKNQFTCDNGRCIDKDLKCDRDDDCGDGSDEKFCDILVNCPSNMYKCASSSRCLPEKTRCDGVKDCPEGDDENSCPKVKKCKNSEFQCPEEKSCIPIAWLCDGENDCGDNTDETLPQCHYVKEKSTSTVLPQQVYPELEEDFDNFSSNKSRDENIGKVLPGQNKMRAICREGEYSCASGECIPTADLCNHRSDCSDNSDEGPFCSTACAVDNGGCAELCLATPPGPICRCRVGFVLADDGKNCKDVDECSYLGTCSQYCHNVPGTFVCSCAAGYVLRADHRSCKAEGVTPKLLLAFQNKILAYTVGANHVEVIAHNNEFDIRDVDFDSKLGDIYWIDYIKGSISKYSSSGTSLVLKTLENPTALAVDWISRLLIFWDAKGYLIVCTIDGEYCANILYVGQRNVKDIEVDARYGKIYWSAWSSSTSSDDGIIEQTCANGRRRSALVSEKLIWPSGLTLDYFHESIIWVDVHLQVIEMIELSGHNRRTITRKDVNYPMSLTLFEDLLYWADWGKNSIIRCDKFTCEDRVVTLEHVIKVNSMTMYHPAQQPNGSSPCASRQNKCSHICVMVPMGYSCLCPLGMQFNDTENTTCVLTPKSPRSGFYLEQCDEKSCFNGGTCFIKNHDLVCVCTNQWMGERCELISNLVSGAMNNADSNSGESHGWVAGVIVTILFIMTAGVAVMLYYRKFGTVWIGKEKLMSLRGAFAPKPFVNPLFGANGEPIDEEEYENHPGYVPYENSEETYRSYSNPSFESGAIVDLNSNMRNGKVKFRVSDPCPTLDTDSTSEDASTATLIDLTPGLRRHH